ncbi:hypothetical protein [Xenorhabdus siamensis]|uniref:hypothetical protein n=1 Tax=Xenorhabdus siamensis TaxID=3136254 RepID=UPI0030F4B0AD
MSRVKIVSEVPNPKAIELLRKKMSLTQTELGEIMGLTLRAWQKKEAAGENVHHMNATKLVPGEYNFLLLMADLHPYYQLTETFDAQKMVMGSSTAEEVKHFRTVLGLTTSEMAKLMGYSLSTWLGKEYPKKDLKKLKRAEYNFLLLLTEEHPNMKIIRGVGKDLKQYHSKTLTAAEYHLLLLISDLHPYYRLEEPFEITNLIKEMPEELPIEALRNTLQLTQSDIANLTEYTVAAWQAKEKEQATIADIKLRAEEYNYLLLLAGKHPNMKMLHTAPKTAS